LKVDTEPSIALALVSAMSSPMPSHGQDEPELRIVEVEFIGELPKDDQGRPMSFRRGISTYPALGDLVFRASKNELAMAYACDKDSSIRIGRIQQDAAIPAMVKIDELLGKHFAVLGTTGTGKSCAVALILSRILERNPQAHVLLLDVHREYAPAFRSTAEVISPDNMNLPFWLLNFEEIVEVLIGNQPHKDSDAEILRELIPQAKLRYLANQRRDRQNSLRDKVAIENSNIGVDTPIPYRSSDLIGLLEENIGKLELRGELAPYKRLKARTETITRDPRYSFMFGGLTVQDTMVQILSRLFRVPVNGKPITILELGGLPSEVINVVVSVLARLAFDFGLWSGGRVPITFVCEEAHRYVPIDRSLGFEPTKRSISRIAKEGRKYGVSLAIITQRPAELDPTILSQCNTIFSFRLSNERDQEILKAGISDAASSLLEFVPTMGTGEAVTFGEGVALPTRMKFDLMPDDSLPRSTTASFSHNWSTEIPDGNFLADIVARWRQQTFNSPPDNTVQEAPDEPAQPVAAPPPPPTFGAVRLRTPLARNGSAPQPNSVMFSGGGQPRAWAQPQAPQSAVQRPPQQRQTDEFEPKTPIQQSLARLIMQYRS
ncbi:MAG: ATP-binding protein, partial [Pseudomonadota bacterium]